MPRLITVPLWKEIMRENYMNFLISLRSLPLSVILCSLRDECDYRVLRLHHIREHVRSIPEKKKLVNGNDLTIFVTMVYTVFNKLNFFFAERHRFLEMFEF